MNTTATIKVKWNARLGGGYTAIAEENKGGYTKGDIITVLPYEPRVLQTELCIICKNQQNDSI